MSAFTFIDTHAHLNFDPFIREPEPYIERMLAAGVEKVIVPGIDIATSEAAVALAEKFNAVYAAVGVHPHDCVNKPADYLKIVEKLAAHPKVVALGEIGMDFFRDYAPADIQETAFREQLELAQSLNLPFIMHDRAADDAVWKVLSAVDYWAGQAHCYTGAAGFARDLIARGMLVSFTGVITFAKDLADVVQALPLEKLMIETDSPFMAPKPWRGKTCEPMMVTKVAEKIADIFSVDISAVSKITARNAKHFFRID